MLGLIIQICSRILGFSVVAGYNPCKKDLAETQYRFMAKSADMLNSNIKLFWFSTGERRI